MNAILNFFLFKIGIDIYEMRDAHLWKRTKDEEDAEDDLYTYEEPPVEVQLDSGSGVLKKQRVSYDDEDDEALGNLKFALQKN